MKTLYGFIDYVFDRVFSSPGQEYVFSGKPVEGRQRNDIYYIRESRRPLFWLCLEFCESLATED